MESYVLTHFNMKDYIKDLKDESREEAENALLKRLVLKNYSKGLSETEIAEVLDINTETIKQILSEQALVK